MIDNIGFILYLITFGINIFTCLISFMIVILIIHYICYNRMKKEDRTVVSLCVTIYLLTLVSAAILVSFNIQTLLGYLYEQDFNSSWCIFIGYLFSIFLGALYWTFVNQAFFRLCRIVYSTYRWLQYFWLYMILFFVELILICILLCPVLVWHDIVYLPEDYLCYVAFTDIRGVFWLILSDYGVPLLLLSLIYLRITIFIRQQPNNQTVAVKQRQQRDLLIIRRIFVIVSLLMSLGIPTIVLLIIFYITGKKPPHCDPIVWLSISLSLMLLSLSLFIVTPQLKAIVLKKFQHNRVVPLDAPLSIAIPKRHQITTE